MNRLHQLRAYLTYWLDEVDEHSLHSPFFYDLYNDVIKKKTPVDGSGDIENLRIRLLNSDAEIEVHDLGSGSVLPSGKRKIAAIAKSSLSSRKFSQLYARLIAHFKCTHIVELGTSLGINTLYLSATPGTVVTTFEGSDTIAAYAQSTFEFAGRKNIRLIQGNIDRTLPDFTGSCGKQDFIFIDANHRYEPTLRYFKTLLPRTNAQTLVLVDDIHQSPGMERAWNELKSDPTVYGSVDLFKVGILFFDPSLNKQHVVLQF